MLKRMKLPKKAPETVSDLYSRTVVLLGMNGVKAFAHIHSNTDFIAIIVPCSTTSLCYYAGRK